MKKISCHLIIALVSLFLLAGCNLHHSEEQQEQGQLQEQEQPRFTEPATSVKPVPQPTETEPVDPIKEQIQHMSLDEKVGQLVIVGMDGYENDETTLKLIQQYHVGGFILFKQNIKDAPQTLQLINSLKAANASFANPLPLFISVDEEGGKVSRMPQEFIKLLSNQAIGKVNKPKFSYEIGKVIGEELSSFGFNLNFAPVLDINSNPKNPVIGERSFGNRVELVRSLGIETMKGIRAKNVIPAVKHFPGHGDTSVDSHIGLPVVNKDLNSLLKFELVPFAEAIRNDTDMIMIAHILMSKLDGKNPASFSKAVIRDLLRVKMNYHGVVITDDMSMGAIVENYNMEEAAVKSVAAGSDIVLVCHEYDKEIAVIKALKQAVLNGTLSEKRLDQSVYRIIRLKQKYRLNNKKIDAIDVDRINADIQNVLEKNR